MSVAWASGKVILIGEHAVVHGRAAIALAAQDGVTAIVRPATSARSSIRVYDDRGVALTRTERFDRALAALLGETLLESPVDVEMLLAIPPGGGLGASAAMGVALARALDPSAEPEVWFHRAMEWETIFHGSPSGVDVAASLFGGCIRFQRGELTRRIALGRRLRVCVGHSGAASETNVVVERIRRLRHALPERVEAAFDRLGELADLTEDALVRADLGGVGRALDAAQHVLGALGLSTATIDDMCTRARRAGAFGAKLSGAGCGGAVIAVAEDHAIPSVISAWRSNGFEARVIEVPARLAHDCLHEVER